MERLRTCLAVLALSLSACESAFAADAEILLVWQSVTLWGGIIIGVILLLYGASKFAGRVSAQKTRKTENNDSKIEFMVSTFHELVHKLKEKEHELDELRKVAESRAEDIESYNENILQSVPSGVISFDDGLRITRINSAAEKILGICAKECVQKRYDGIFMGRISEIIGGVHFLERAEVLHMTHSGRRVWLGLSVSPLRNRQGLVLGKIMVFTDLTDLKAMESQVRLRENLSNLGEMSAGIAHELRNPMGVIAGYTGLLRRHIPENLREYVVSIENEIQMMNKIISDFMSFAHPVSPNVAQVSLSDLIRDVVKTIVNDNQRIDFRIEGVGYEVEADEALLRQVLVNLVQNSVESMSGKGILTISSWRDGGYVKIVVRDTGHGISTEMAKKVFLPFYTTKAHGTGLGLAIVHKIVTAHGGTIDFESSDRGSEFTISLPQP